MTSRDRYMIIGFAVLAILGGFWMFLLKPQQKAAADAQANVATAKTALQNAQAKVTSGKAAQAAFRRDRATIVKIGRVVPETDDIPTLITQLETIAKKYDVYFLKITIGGSSGTAASSSSSSSSTSSSTASSASSTAQPGSKDADSTTNAVAPLYPPGSTQISGGLGRTPIQLSLRGQYFNLERYLHAVQQFAVLSAKGEKTDGRLMLVDGFSYKSGDLVFLLGKSKVEQTQRWLEADLAASVYFAPPLDTPSASSSSSAAAGTATPATSTGSSTTSTGTAAVGGLR